MRGPPSRRPIRVEAHLVNLSRVVLLDISEDLDVFVGDELVGGEKQG